MKIKVKGSNLEMLDIEVNEEQVQEMWNTNSEQREQINQLTKDLEHKLSSLTYKSEEINRLNYQLREGHILLTMLGVADKDNNEESYNRTILSISTRIALYIAGKLNA
jgi:hypothetical protein